MSRQFSKIQSVDKEQCLVQTPYGRGLVLRTRTNDHPRMKEIDLLDWKVPANASPTTTKVSSTTPAPFKDTSHRYRPRTKQHKLYTAIDYPSVLPKVDDHVICTYGRGVVTAIQNRKSDRDDSDTNNGDNNNANGDEIVVVVQLSSWRLAGRSRVTCYLQPSVCKVVLAKTVSEMNQYERVERAMALKQVASELFSSKQYSEAKIIYGQAVDSVRFVQHDATSTNELRADLVVVMITCCNNAATCCVNLLPKDKDEKKETNEIVTDDGIKFAKNALVLIDALYEKKGFKIHKILRKEGHSDAKLFGVWKVKSLLLTGQFHRLKREYGEAIQLLKQAHEIVATYTAPTVERKDEASVQSLLSQERQIKKLHSSCVLRRKQEKKKEKERAKAMFGGGTGTSSPNRKGTLSSPTRAAAAPTTASAFATNSPINILYDEDKKNDEKSIRMGKSVSFSDIDEVNEFVKGEAIGAEGDEADLDSDPWYQEHAEAMILTFAIAGAATLATVWLRSKK